MRIFLSKPHMSGRERDYVSAAFDSNFIAPIGPQLDALEASMTEYLGGGLHCVALVSGSSALHLALRISGVQRHDSVWISSMTFAGGIFPVLYMGAKPVFFDLDPATWTLDSKLICEALDQATLNGTLPRAIVPTDLFGQSVDLDPLEEKCRELGIKLIVDSAESLGATYKKGRKCGTGGEMSILSFNGNKIITTSGGGMLVTGSEAYAEEARFLATQARDPAAHYEHSTYGYNYRMSNICAAIGLGQMEVLDARVDARRRIRARYAAELNHPGITFMPEPEGYRSSMWLTTLTVDPDICGVTREDIRKELLKHQIEARPIWKPMHMQPLFEGFSYHGAGVDEQLFSDGLCLPSGSDLTEEEQSEVIERVWAMLRSA